jgi:hypothetical protein
MSGFASDPMDDNAPTRGPLTSIYAPYERIKVTNHCGEEVLKVLNGRPTHG